MKKICKSAILFVLMLVMLLQSCASTTSDLKRNPIDSSWTPDEIIVYDNKHGLSKEALY